MSSRERERPDTSKNGLLKRRQLNVEESVKERGRSILARLNQKRQRPVSDGNGPTAES